MLVSVLSTGRLVIGNYLTKLRFLEPGCGKLREVTVYSPDPTKTGRTAASQSCIGAGLVCSLDAAFANQLARTTCQADLGYDAYPDDVPFIRITGRVAGTCAVDDAWAPTIGFQVGVRADGVCRSIARGGYVKYSCTTDGITAVTCTNDACTEGCSALAAEFIPGKLDDGIKCTENGKVFNKNIISDVTCLHPGAGGAGGESGGSDANHRGNDNDGNGDDGTPNSTPSMSPALFMLSMISLSLNFFARETTF